MPIQSIQSNVMLRAQEFLSARISNNLTLTLTRRHNLVLTAKGSSITDRNFITRMIFKDSLLTSHLSCVCLLLDIVHLIIISFLANVIILLSCCGLSTCIKVFIDWRERRMK